MKKLAIILIILIFLLSFPTVSFKAENETDPEEEIDDEDFDDIPFSFLVQDQYDEQYNLHYGTFKAKLHLASSKKYTFYPIVYSDEVFKQPTNIYNHFLARMSIGLAITSFEMELFNTNNYTFASLDDYFIACGYENLREDDYDKETSLYTVGSMIGSKQINIDGEDTTIIAVAIRSGKYSKEWMSNLTVGDYLEHEGFKTSATLVTDRILSYIAQNNITGNFKIWVTGFSRGAAIANITANNLNNTPSIGSDKVYAYTFATPRNVIEIPGIPLEDDPNIFNILGASDVVTQFAPADWGFTRYGTDYYLPGQEFDSDFNKYYRVVKEKMKELGYDTYYNVSLNLRMRLLIGILTEFIEDKDDYVNYLQEKIISIMDEKTLNNVIIQIQEIIKYYDDSSRDNSAKIDNVINFLKIIIPPVLTGKDFMTDQVNSTTTALLNMMHEHFPEIYLLMLYNFDESIFSNAKEFSYVLLDNKADYILRDIDNGKIIFIDRKGNVSSPSSQLETIGVDVTKYSSNILLTLPHDRHYGLTYTSDTNRNLHFEIINATRDTSHGNNGFEMDLKNTKGQTGNLLEIKDGKIVINANLHEKNFKNSEFAQTLGVYKKGLSWRLSITIIIFIVAIILCLGPIICYLLYVIINKKKFKFLSIINITIFTAMCFECELSYWFFPDTPYIHIIWEIALAFTAIITYIINHKFKDNNIFDTLLPPIILLSFSIIFVNIILIPSVIFFILALIYLIGFMIRKIKPTNVIIILMIAVTIIAELLLIPILKNHKTYAIIFMILVPFLVLVGFNALNQEARLGRTTLILILSIIMLYISLVTKMNVIPHLLAQILFSISLIAYSVIYSNKEKKKKEIIE